MNLDHGRTLRVLGSFMGNDEFLACDGLPRAGFQVGRFELSREDMVLEKDSQFLSVFRLQKPFQRSLR